MNTNDANEKPAIEVTYYCNRVLKNRDKLRDELIPDLVNERLSPGYLDIAVATTRRVLGSTLPINIIEESLSSSVGELMTRDALHEIAWRLAGNSYRIRNHRRVSPWTMQRYREWVPIHINSARRQRNYGKVGHEFTCRILAGSPAGLLSRVFWGDKFVTRLARSLGFKPVPRGKRFVKPTLLFRHPLGLVNLRMLALIDPELSQEGEPGFRTVKATGSLVSYNRRRLESRDRIGFECPRGYTKSVLCHTCPAGLNSCKAAVRQQDAEIKRCVACDAVSVFDKDVSVKFCINCFNKKALSGDN